MADVEIDIGLKLDQIDKSLKDLEDKVKKGAGDAGEGAGRSFGAGFGKIFSANLLANLASSAIAAGFRNLNNILNETFRSSIAASQAQQDAVNNLNNALKTSGDFSQEASRQLQDFASDLQQVTRFGDETVLGQLALAKSFGATNEQAKEIVTAAADLSAAFGIDLQSATRNVAKTLGGFAGELGEVIPELKTLGTEALQSGAGITLLADRFRGAAQRDVATFSGSLDQLKNIFGDLQEALGSIVTENQFVAVAFARISQIIKETIPSVTSFAKSFDFFNDLVDPVITLGNAFIAFLVQPLELVFNIAKLVFDAFNTGVATITAAVGTIIEGGARLAEFFGAGGVVTQALKDFGDTSREVALENTAALSQSFNALITDGNTTFSDGLAERLAQFRQFNQEIAIEAQVQNENLAVANDGLAKNLQRGQQAAVKSTQSLAKGASQAAKQANQIISGGLAQGISGGIQNIIASIAAGEDAFANFGKFLLNTFGDLAIQLGTFFIAQGIAVEALQAVSGTGAIAAGIGLVALGALLKSFGGGAGASSSGGGAIGGASTDPTNVGATQGAFVEPDQAERAEEQTAVNITVQGSLVQQDELGEFLNDTLTRVRDRRGSVAIT